MAIERGACPGFRPGRPPVEREGIYRVRRETRQPGEVSLVVGRGGHAAVGPLHPSACEGVRRGSQPHWRLRQQLRGTPRAAARYDRRLGESVGLRPRAQGIQSRRGGRGELSGDGSGSIGDAAAVPQHYRGRSGRVLTDSFRLSQISSLAHRARRRRHDRPDRSGGDDVRGVDEGGRANVIHANQGRGTRVRGRRCRASLCRTDTVVRAASRGATGRGRGGGCRARRRRRAPRGRRTARAAAAGTDRRVTSAISWTARCS